MTRRTRDLNALTEFLAELKLMACVGKHKNIVEFIGAVVDDIRTSTLSKAWVWYHNKNMLTFAVSEGVVELSAHGDLLNYLRRQDGQSYDRLITEDRVERRHLCYFCEQIAAGMAFLADKHVSRSKIYYQASKMGSGKHGFIKVVHGDLAARNVLVFPELTVKITDFGLSAKLYNDAACYRRKGNVRWNEVDF